MAAPKARGKAAPQPRGKPAAKRTGLAVQAGAKVCLEIPLQSPPPPGRPSLGDRLPPPPGRPSRATPGLCKGGGGYNADKVAHLLEKRHEEECKEKVAERDATIFAALDRCRLLPNLTSKKLTVDILKGAIKATKASSTFQYAGLRVGGNRASLLDQIEAVLEPYEAQDLSFVYKA